MIDVQARYDEVERFNHIAGNLDNVSVSQIESQMKVVVEEVKELQDAFDNHDALELLDGACDSFVTLMGLLQQMEKAGFKVNEAIERVNHNNLDKFKDWIDEDENAIYKEKGWKVDFHLRYSCCIIKDQNGKIRKPVDFQSVLLDDLVPESFFGI